MDITGFITAAACVGSAVYFVILAKPRNCRNAIRRWEKKFDIIAHGQRYQGARALPLFNFYSEKMGLLGYKSKTLYRTPSGRFFEIDLVCELGAVVSWQLDIIDPEDASAFLALIGAKDESTLEAATESQVNI